MFKFDRYKLTGALWAVAILFVGIYVFMLFDSSYKEAKKFIEENQTIANTIGPIQYAFVLPFGRNKVHKASCGIEANYEFSVVGNEAGKVYIRLIPGGDEWKVQRANLVTADSRVVVLKDEQEVSKDPCQK